MARIKEEIEDAYDLMRVKRFVEAADASLQESNEALMFTVLPLPEDNESNIIALAEVKSAYGESKPSSIP